MNGLFSNFAYRIAAMFHGQTVDFKSFFAHGTFLTNPAQGLVPAGLRMAAEEPCTELSTVGVDKDHSR